MLIAITAESPDTDSKIAEKFGRAPFIIIYDTVNNTSEYLHNPFINLYGGAGIQTSQFIIENNVEAVITKDIGPNPLRFLKSADIKVYLCTGGKIIDAIKDFIQMNLIEVKQESMVNTVGRRQKGKRRNRHRKL
ncbi:MAG: NifB/NifX family molybdenum-iron cluster-binding protein [Bacteroidetes bacterium]|nr:NifB/NifX family molybdenum-iron cluster-binding protein [Bacteroidota bacterium]